MRFSYVPSFVFLLVIVEITTSACPGAHSTDTPTDGILGQETSLPKDASRESTVDGSSRDQGDESPAHDGIAHDGIAHDGIAHDSKIQNHDLPLPASDTITTCVPGTGCVCPNGTYRQGTHCVPHPSFTIPLPTGYNTNLRCHIPWADPLHPTPLASLVGSKVSSTVGLDPQMSAIGARFTLKNNTNSHVVDILETRSGAGAAWQTSFLAKDNPAGGNIGLIVFNQAAGNSTPYQWAYPNTIAVSGTGNELHALQWNPIYSDHIHGVIGAHSPCTNTGYCFDDGKPDIFGRLITTAHGKALLWINTYTHKSRINQWWPSYFVEQAFYLKRKTARDAHMRLFLRKGTSRYGPYALYDTFSISGANTLCRQTSNGSFCDNEAGYDYAVLVWNIFGLDIGVAIPDLHFGASINLEKGVYCPDQSNDSCGNINFHTWLAREKQVSFPKGSIRTYAAYYYVGTLAQLADLGYETW